MPEKGEGVPASHFCHATRLHEERVLQEGMFNDALRQEERERLSLAAGAACSLQASPSSCPTPEWKVLLPACQNACAWSKLKVFVKQHGGLCS